MKNTIFKKLGVLSLALGFCSSGLAVAATSQIDYINTLTVIVDNGGLPLTAGGNASGDGAVMQIGYFTVSTSTFEGDWVALTGLGSANPALLTSIGDGGDSTSLGIFSGSAVFNDGNGNASSLPTAGTQLAIRFFNDVTVEGSTHFNTVTSSSWNFVALATPAPLPESLDMDNAVLVWEDSENTFRTSIVIPEPSALLLGTLGLFGLMRRRR